MKMRRALLTCVFLVLVMCVGSAYAGEQFVTCEQLSISNIKEALARDIRAISKNHSLREIYGIFQRGKDAEVFFSFAVEGNVKKSSAALVRFNSGKWFNVDREDFLGKSGETKTTK